jgi:hypothetical protein
MLIADGSRFRETPHQRRILVRRSKTFAVVLAAFGVVAAFLVPPAASAQALTSFGPYQFRNDFSHLCMNVTSGSTADGGRIEQWDCYGGTPEQWRLDPIATVNGKQYYEVVNVNSGKCLDVPGGNTAGGVELQQWSCWGGDMQLWALFGTGTSSLTVRNLRSGLCLDDKDWGGAGAALQQWDCNQAAVQTWQLS